MGSIHLIDDGCFVEERERNLEMDYFDDAIPIGSSMEKRKPSDID